MGMNDTPRSVRLHIGFFGRRNAGKSSVVNAVTGQQLAVVSDTMGTTTDPVYKSMELLPLGPVVIVDTPGFDDEGSLGELRVKKTREVLRKVDVAILVVDATEGIGGCEKELISLFEERDVAYLLVYNKCDLLESVPADTDKEIYISALKEEKIYELKEKIGSSVTEKKSPFPLLADLVQPGDLTILVTPIDSAAPKGRMILPQQQAIRDALDADAAAVVIKENMVAETIQSLAKKPVLVVTDSQAFKSVNKDVPEEIPLTSFSILMARHKGTLKQAVLGAAAMSKLQDGDTVLIAEGCTHHRQCDDIGTVKLPRWLDAYTGKKLQYEFTSGVEFPDDLSKYSLVLHCGGCMLNDREMLYRMRHAAAEGVPMTNYGVAIAQINGILKRSIAMLSYLDDIRDLI